MKQQRNVRELWNVVYTQLKKTDISLSSSDWAEFYSIGGNLSNTEYHECHCDWLEDLILKYNLNGAQSECVLKVIHNRNITPMQDTELMWKQPGASKN